jgi:hypothetical protein
MSAARIFYRTRQFWHGLWLTPTASEMDRGRSMLNPAEFNLFNRLQPGEQSHSLTVFDKLSAAGEKDPDLLAAALLHDVGKILYPLKLWERVWIVIGRAFFPHLSREWALGDLGNLEGVSFWKRAFIVAEQHPRWGADLAAQANSSQLVVNLIRRHQETLAGDEYSINHDQPAASRRNSLESHRFEDGLLQKLQAVDDES